MPGSSARNCTGYGSRTTRFLHTSPSGFVSASQVIKIPDFAGSLPPRALYVYLPRGYAEHIDKRYPVLYMHDGQNCFETYSEDSYAGTWRAEEAADAVIGSGQMRECIIVGVSNGRNERMAEYLPPYASYRMPSRPAARQDVNGSSVAPCPAHRLSGELIRLWFTTETRSHPTSMAVFAH